MKKLFTLAATLLVYGLLQAETEKPKILVIWGDDIGITNISAYSGVYP